MKIVSIGLLTATALVLGGVAGYRWAPKIVGSEAEKVAATVTPGERKVLYYRNPMGLPDTSPVPKKDPMGMDYLPVYAGDEVAETGLRISPEKIQSLGVKTEKVQKRVVDRDVRAAGRIEMDETRLRVIAPKFEGYIERLHVNVTGQTVGRGQPLLDVYSPELVSAQKEYALAREGLAALSAAGEDARSGMQRLAEASLERLRNWDIPAGQLETLANQGTVSRHLTLRSPVSGVVLERKAVQGQRFQPGEALFQIADLSSVWVLADVFEQDVSALRVGQPAEVRVQAYPGERWTGKIDYIYPTLRPETRTVQVRVALPNPGQRLKPAMYAELAIPVAERAVLAVPTSAVIEGGRRQVVIVRRDEQRFEPREVRLGERGAQYVAVLDGLSEGETVVIAANFLIDAESNLKAALTGMQGADTAAAKTVGHQATGTLNAVDTATGSVTVSHGPVPSLNWPPMKMEFSLANPALLQGLKPGDSLTFEFVERKPGEWVITQVKPGTSGR